MNHHYKFYNENDVLIIQVSSKTSVFHTKAFIDDLNKAFKTNISRIEVVAPDEREFIVSAANWYADGKEYVHQPKNIDSGFVICGRRHHNVFYSVYMLITLLGDTKESNEKRIELLNQCEQGFITSKNRWVDRIEGMKIASAAGQTIKTDGELFSEDLY
jgi:hypothetical protein